MSSRNSIGQKLKKTVVYSDSIKIVDYLDGFQTEERGSRMPVGALATQLSNNEQNYTATLASFDLEILNFQSLTRPFGLKHSVYSAGRLRDFEVDSSNPEGEQVFLTPVTKTEYQYKYNGQEWQDELGLNMYAMDMRQYDPAIARWVAQDPVIHHSMSPYNAFDNNPVFWADPSGADAVDIGYDRIIDSQDMMGSFHWSGGFQEIENEGGEGVETQKGNSSSSEQRASQDNGDPNEIQKRIVKNANSKEGDTSYAFDKKKDNFDEFTDKCNKFIYDVLKKSGANPNTPNGNIVNRVIGNGSPVLAGQWGDPTYRIPGWAVVTTPQAGDIVAAAYNYSNGATGHVAIMISTTHSIGANAEVVRITDFGSNPAHLKEGSQYVYRRYVGATYSNSGTGGVNPAYRQFP